MHPYSSVCVLLIICPIFHVNLLIDLRLLYYSEGTQIGGATGKLTTRKVIPKVFEENRYL